MTTQPATNLSLVKPPLPTFEGSNVESVTSKISGNVSIDGSDDKVLCIDDRVRMVGQYRVVGVHFKVDAKTGDTVREHILKPIEMELCPFDPADPADDGIVRARPSSVPVP